MWMEPDKIIYPGYYWVRNNRIDIWIAYCDPKDLNFDKHFGYGADDGIKVCGPIERPE